MLGRTWIAGQTAAAQKAFVDSMEALLRDGDGERVIEVSQALIGETKNKSVIPLLTEFAMRGRLKVNTQIH